jgi:ComF family protein
MSLLDLLFVPHCPACDARLNSPEPLCAACSISLYDLGPACPRCAEPHDGPVALECARCRRKPPPFARTVAPYRYGGELGAALRRLKYEPRPDIARTIAPLLAPALARAANDVDLIMPIPLHWRRMARRGFNQSALLLDFAARGLQVPIDRVSLRRNKATSSQSRLSARRRAANVADAFAVAPRRRKRVRGRRVLLFDDIMTTGATLSAAARTLLEAGATEVVAFCAARAESD